MNNLQLAFARLLETPEGQELLKKQIERATNRVNTNSVPDSIARGQKTVLSKTKRNSAGDRQAKAGKCTRKGEAATGSRAVVPLNHIPNKVTGKKSVVCKARTDYYLSIGFKMTQTGALMRQLETGEFQIIRIVGDYYTVEVRSPNGLIEQPQSFMVE